MGGRGPASAPATPPGAPETELVEVRPGHVAPAPRPTAGTTDAPLQSDGATVLSDGATPARAPATTPSGQAVTARPHGDAAVAPARAADGGAVTGQSAPAEPPSLGRLLAVVAETIDRLPLLDDSAVAEGTDELAAQIRRVIADNGTPVEAKLARVLEGLASRADLEQMLPDDLRANLGQLVRETRAHLAAPNAESLPPETLRDLRAVHGRAEALLGTVEMQQLANAAPRTDGQPSYLVFQLPIPGGREPQSAQIRVRQDADGGDARIDPKNLHVVFQFEMEHLRTVRIGLRIQENRVSCQIGSSDPRATHLLAAGAPALREGLAELGYLVEPVRTALLTPEELAPPPTAAQPARAPRPAVMRLDARA